MDITHEWCPKITSGEATSDFGTTTITKKSNDFYSTLERFGPICFFILSIDIEILSFSVITEEGPGSCLDFRTLKLFGLAGSNIKLCLLKNWASCICCRLILGIASLSVFMNVLVASLGLNMINDVTSYISKMRVATAANITMAKPFWFVSIFIIL
jgi:hypothetical protein